jgi:Ca2+-binding EF-hand superfamily protein
MLFSVELFLRVMKMGCRKQFFTSEERAWAWLDLLVILGGLVELATGIIWLASADDGEKMSGSGTLRNVRLVRVVRITRAFRLQRIIRVISGLRTLVYSIAVTLKSLMWAMVLLSIIMYVFSLAFTIEAITLLEDMMDHGGVQADVAVELERAWGSLDRSMMTLFQSICGGVSWRDVVDPFRGSTVLPAYLFIIYMCFTYFAVLNVVTGIFCTSALETTQRNPDLVAKTLIDKRRQSTKMLRSLFGAIDDDDSGVITTDELDAISNNEMVLAYFQALDIDFRDAWTLFKLIDVDKTGAVKLDDFLTGCEQLRGGATNVHIAEIAHDVKKIGRTVKNLITRVDSITGIQKSAIKTNGDGTK